MKAVVILVALVLAAANLANAQPCQLSSIRPWYNLTERAMEGSWFEIRWYTSSEFDNYENYAYYITPESSGLRVRSLWRSPPEAPCSQIENILRPRISNGVYEYYSQEYKRYVRSIVTFVDPLVRFFTEYICLEWRGDICYTSEYAMFYRAPFKKRGIRCPRPDNIEEMIRNQNVDRCIDVNRFMRILHREPSCFAVTNQPISFGETETSKSTYQTVPNYYYFNYNEYGKELIEAIVAEKEKLVAEKEKFAEEIQLVKLQNEYLRRGYVQG